MLEIIGFSFKNFKGLIDANVTFADRNWSVIPVVGLNESGKTTLLEAIYALTISLRERNSVYINHFLSKCQTISLVQDNKVIKFSLELSTKNKKYVDLKNMMENDQVIQFLSNKAKMFIDVDIDISGSNVFIKSILNIFPIEDTILPKKDTKESKTKIEVEPLRMSINIPLLNDTPKIYFFSGKYPIIPNSFDPKEPLTNIQAKNDWEVFQSLFESENVTINQLLELLNREDINEQRLIKDKVNRKLKNVSSNFSDLIIKIFDIQNKDSQIKDLKLEIEFVDNKCSLVLKRFDTTFAFDKLSDGIRWIASLVFVIEVLLRNKENVLLILDEPGDHLHPNAQQILINYVIKALGTKNKLIYSTHSHHMIPREYVDDVLVVKNSLYKNIAKGDVDITIQNYTQFIKENGKYESATNDSTSRNSYTDPILKLLQHSRSEFELQPTSIITEGKIDFFVFAYFLEILKKKQPKRYTLKSSMLRPGNSASTTPHLALECFNKGQKFLVILDSDQAGKDAEKKIKANECLPSKVYKLGDIFQEGTKTIRETEDLFEQNDIEMLKMFRPSFESDKDKSDKEIIKEIIKVGMRQLLIMEKYQNVNTQQEYKFSNITMKRFKKIFDTIEKQFSISINK